MKMILASSFNNYQKDKYGNKKPVALPNNNKFLFTIISNIKNINNVVLVVSDPTNIVMNDFFADLLFNSLSLSGLCFKNKIILDNRNKEDALEIIKNADLIFLAGGSVKIQSKFFSEINFKKILSEFNGLVVAGSAGAMNLCKTTVNFEEKNFIPGIGMFDKIIIPHFDGKNRKYLRDGKDALNDLLDLSDKKEIIAFDNDSFIFKDENETKYFGEFYIIKNGQIGKMNIN